MTRRIVIAEQPWRVYKKDLPLPADHPQMPMRPNYNAAPGETLPIMIETENKRIMIPARWGLVPFFWDKPLSEMTFNTFNARLESAGKTLSFKGPIQYRRCLVPATGYYVWTGPRGDRQPHFVSDSRANLCVMAGTWDEIILDGELIFSFAIVTVPATGPLKNMSARMPLILSKETHEDWMDIHNPAKGFMHAAVANLQAWPVDRQVNNPQYNTPSACEAIY